jgi:hypothetical protein
VTTGIKRVWVLAARARLGWPAREARRAPRARCEREENQGGIAISTARGRGYEFKGRFLYRFGNLIAGAQPGAATLVHRYLLW